MLFNYSTCPTCKSKEIEQFVYYEKFPAILFPVEVNRKNCVIENSLTAFKCNLCNHVFLNNIDLDFVKKIYALYYDIYPLGNLESMQDIYRIPFESVFDFFYKQGTSLLEIGCGNEQQLQKFIDLGLDCTAINPSYSSFTKANFISGFYEDGVEGTFDYILARFVLEHIVTLDKFLTQINYNLKDSGLAFLQVPNIEMYFKSNILNIFAHEHIQYFCRVSMKILLERNGFNVLYLNNTNSNGLICVIEKNNKSYNPEKSLQGNKELFREIYHFLDMNSNKDIIFYGAGLTLTGILYSSGIDIKKITIVDDNPVVHSRYMPNTEFKIVTFSECDVGENTIVLLTINPFYYDRVISYLTQFNLGGVFGIFNQGIRKII